MQIAVLVDNSQAARNHISRPPRRRAKGCVTEIAERHRSTRSRSSRWPSGRRFSPTTRPIARKLHQGRQPHLRTGRQRHVSARRDRRNESGVQETRSAAPGDRGDRRRKGRNSAHADGRMSSSRSSTSGPLCTSSCWGCRPTTSPEDARNRRIGARRRPAPDAAAGARRCSPVRRCRTSSSSWRRS